MNMHVKCLNKILGNGIWQSIKNILVQVGFIEYMNGLIVIYLLTYFTIFLHIEEENIYSHLDVEKALDKIQHPFSTCGVGAS